MPNHCSNTLYVPKEFMPVLLEKYVKKDECNNDIFDFEAVVPIGNPETTSDWYKQRIEKWGTKWEGYDLCISQTGIDFMTAWSPPIPIIKELAGLYKEVSFRLEYFEGGVGFRGEYTARWNGEEIIENDDCWEMTREDFEELGLLDESDDLEEPGLLTESKEEEE